MKVFSAVVAIIGAANAFAPSTPVLGFGRGVNQLAVAPTVSAHASSSMTMSLGFGSNGGFNRGPAGIARNFFIGKGKSGDGAAGGSNNGNKEPPSGSLGAGSSADDGRRKAESGLKGLWQAYTNSLDKNPIFTKALTSMLGFALGDFLAQKFIDKRDNLDLNRLGRMASFGLLVHGPTGHFFYNALDAKIRSNGAAAVASKVFIDQVIWNPIFGTMFFGYMGAAEGLSPGAIKERVRTNLWASVKGSWTVWPVAHAINFRFVPTSQRLLYINSIQIGYNMFLSVLAKKANAGGIPAEVSSKVNKAGRKIEAKGKQVKHSVRQGSNAVKQRL